MKDMNILNLFHKKIKKKKVKYTPRIEHTFKENTFDGFGSFKPTKKKKKLVQESSIEIISNKPKKDGKQSTSTFSLF